MKAGAIWILSELFTLLLSAANELASDDLW